MMHEPNVREHIQKGPVKKKNGPGTASARVEAPKCAAHFLKNSTPPEDGVLLLLQGQGRGRGARAGARPTRVYQPPHPDDRSGGGGGGKLTKKGGGSKGKGKGKGDDGTHRCGNCDAPDAKRKCNGCGVERYCGEECQKVRAVRYGGV